VLIFQIKNLVKNLLTLAEYIKNAISEISDDHQISENKAGGMIQEEDYAMQRFYRKKIL
jgi:hypothetical protein